MRVRNGAFLRYSRKFARGVLFFYLTVMPDRGGVSLCKSKALERALSHAGKIFAV